MTTLSQFFDEVKSTAVPKLDISAAVNMDLSFIAIVLKRSNWLYLVS